MAPDVTTALFDEGYVTQLAGHPERFTTRWRLIGAGLSNVWRFGDLHLDAPSGRLLLRGPNGTGKTTALEALWPYLLDLNAQRLAAGKARPTSLALLMREGANGAKRRCGYLWLTLAAPADEGPISYGVRLLYSDSSSPAVKVTPFMVPGVPLHDVPLYGPDRGFLSAEQFSATVTGAGGTVFLDEDAYVAHLATRIWVANDRELLELANRIRAVRNPTLLGDVSPRAAADALRDGLPGVSDDVVTATAEALAESDATRAAFKRDQEAAVALDRFAETWAGHVVEVVTPAHAVARQAMSDAAKAERERRGAEEKLSGAREYHGRVAANLKELKDKARDLDATLRALEESEAYKAAGRLADLQGVVEAQRSTAAAALAAFQQAIMAAKGRARTLQGTGDDLVSDLDALASTAGAADTRAAPDHMPLTRRVGPRETYVVGDVSVDPGPRTVIDFRPDRLDELATLWRRLADDHRNRGNDAILAITDRRETSEAEQDAADLAASARQLRLRAEQEQRRLAQATNAARLTMRRLVDDVDTWYLDYSHLATTVENAGQDEHTDVSDDRRTAWRPIEFTGLRDQEPAQVLVEVERLAELIKTVGDAAAAILRHRHQLAKEEAARLRAERDRLRAEARELREGKLLPIPRPAWAGPADDGEAFADAVDWHPDVTDPTARALLEAALAACGLLGATLLRNGVRTAAWYVETSGSPAATNLSTVLVVDTGHPNAAVAAEVLRRIPLLDTSSPPRGDRDLVIGRDGTFSAGPLHGRPPGVDDTAQLRPAELIGAAQRRQAALARAVQLDADADELARQAGVQDGRANASKQHAEQIRNASNAFPSRSAAIKAEAVRAGAAAQAGEAAETARTAETEAAERAEDARVLRTEWERRTRSRGLPIEVPELERLRDDGERNAKQLDDLARQLIEKLRPRLVRLAADAADDVRQCESLPAAHAEAATAAARAAKLGAEHQALVLSVGLDADTALAKHKATKAERETLENEEARVSSTLDTARGAVLQLQAVSTQAETRVAEAKLGAAAAQRDLRTLIDVPGIADVLFGHDVATAIPVPPAASDPEDGIVAAVRQALQGKRPVTRRLLRERYDSCRADLAGLWTLDPGDSYESLDTYVLTHDSVAYTPPAAAKQGQHLKQRAQAALNKAEESALREFVIGRLPLAIGTAWVNIEDWIKDVNRKMQKAAASSGVGVRISKALLKDLSAAELTVYRLACKETSRTAAQQAEIGEALQSLIAGAEGATMTERLANAVDVRKWLDISYEIVRPDGQVNRWTSKTGLSGGERRLVVLAPMLAAVAAFYDQLDLAGLRLAALDEVPAEVDERGREGLARYIAELDLDLICTSYLWDGAPGAWDGIDAWDLEAGPDTTVVAFPMLVRGLGALPGDTQEEVQ